MTWICIIGSILLTCLIIWRICAPKPPESTVNREKLNINASYKNNLVYDELGWIDVNKTSRQLKTFYDKTGIQPALALFDYIDGITGDELACDNYAKSWYDEHVNNEGGLLLAYFDTGTEEEGWAYLVYGDMIKSVMDAEADEIFWSFYDRYWLDDSINLTVAYPSMFNDTANRIMQKTTTGKDIQKITMIIVAIVVVGAFALKIAEVLRDREILRQANDEREYFTESEDAKSDESSGENSSD